MKSYKGNSSASNNKKSKREILEQSKGKGTGFPL
jgi:hypothetical protein